MSQKNGDFYTFGDILKAVNKCVSIHFILYDYTLRVLMFLFEYFSFLYC